MLNDKQRKLIELLITEDYSISAACEAVGINRASYYDWKKGTGKTAREFQKAFEEALELKVKESRQQVKNSLNKHIEILNDIAGKGKNEQAKVNSIGKLWSLAELEDQDVNVNVNNNKDQANHMLELWKQKQQDKDNQTEE